MCDRRELSELVLRVGGRRFATLPFAFLVVPEVLGLHAVAAFGAVGANGDELQAVGASNPLTPVEIRDVRSVGASLMTQQSAWET